MRVRSPTASEESLYRVTVKLSSGDKRSRHGANELATSEPNLVLALLDDEAKFKKNRSVFCQMLSTIKFGK